MAAILQQRVANNVVRLDAFATRRAARGVREPLIGIWGVGPDGVLACRWQPAPMVRRDSARGPAA